MTLRIGTRGSRLAMRQAEILVEKLSSAFPDQDTKIVKIRTSGDAVGSDRTPKVQDKGMFVKEIDRALLDDRVDVAVHSMKDIPVERDEGIALGAILEREDPRDALITTDGCTLENIHSAAQVGTGSLRRRALALYARSDLNIMDIRGNVDTRIEKVRSGELDAVILAQAGILRLRPEDVRTTVIPEDVITPAAGQGAIGVEARADDDEIRSILERVDHFSSRQEVAAERCFLEGVGGGCQVPIGVLARMSSTVLRLQVAVASPDGKWRIDLAGEGSPDDGSGTASKLAKKLVSLGGLDLLKGTPQQQGGS
ncbi:MAG: hydroxymethylbilane synthase [Candidatus Undinarchaeales archaeon]|jgi:hydroxymethylbilane synthase|nr:hydroxymethylbilane synthase [Candidatus Undinarchaeales archaeon]MDP7493883.1 hydroxymethylbilane synthase [Candidatus Undinarchaeales archaeon]